MIISLVLFQNCAPGFDSSGDHDYESTFSSSQLPSANSCKTKVEVPKRRMRLLSKNEYTNTVKSILGNLPAGFTESPLEGIFNGYTNYSDNLIVSESIAQIFFDNSLLIANEILAKNMFQLNTCLADHKSCQSIIKSLLEKVFRGHPIDLKMADKYLKLYTDQFNILKNKQESITMMLSATFQAPQFVYRSELGTDNGGNNYTVLKPHELANELSYLFTHSPPDEKLINDLNNKSFFAGSPAVRKHAMRLSKLSNNTLNTFIKDWLELGELIFKEKKVTLPGTSNAVALSSLNGELNLLSKKIINQNLNYKDIHSLQSTFVNKDNSKIYVDNPQAGNEYKEVHLRKRKGILSMAPFLVGHSNPDSSNPIHRGAFVLRKIVCGELKFPDNIGSLGEVPAGKNFTTRQIVEASTEKPGCINCHISFNGYGFALESFNEWGAYRTTEAGQNINTATTMEIDGQSVHIKDSISMSEFMSTSPKAQSCFSKNMLTYSFSVKSPDECYTQKISRSLAAGVPLKDIFVDIISADQFSWRKK